MSERLRFDTASATSKGGRDYQEDAIISDFTAGAEISIAVLADGMGGQAAGDLASKIVVTEVFRELTFKRDAIVAGKADVPNVLEEAAEAANDYLSKLVRQYPEHRGMGATLLSLLVQGNALSWVSIGDSPLFLFRDNQLSQLNEDHSFGAHISYLVKTGAISEEEGQNHPDKNILTSVLSGDQIPLLDCPKTPFVLNAGDIVLVASDGLQFLSNDQIARILRDRPLCNSADLADALMSELEALNDPDLDNVTLLAIQVRHGRDVSASARLETQTREKSSRSWPFAGFAAGRAQ